MSTPKRVVRQRLWADDSVKGRSVGENMRDIESAVNARSVQTRLMVLSDIIYQAPIVVQMQAKPEAILCVHTERMNGDVQFTSAFVNFKWSDGECRLTINGLTAGERYAAVKLLVIG